MSITFTKMHNLGNDFIVINALTAPIDLTPAKIKTLTDRHLGIGADHVLILEPSQRELQPTTTKNSPSDFHCRIFNQDGSEAGMSGNGMCCLAKFIHTNKLTAKHSFVISTFARKVTVHIEDNGQTTLNIGIPDFTPTALPFITNTQASNYRIPTKLGEFTVGAVSVGNPHVVMTVDDVATVDVKQIGSAIAEQRHLFPEGVNVGFMQIIGRNQIKLRVYERGTGETLACGSGASAAVAIGRLWQLLDEKVTVYLQHGNLVIKWQTLYSPLLLTSSAVIVFNGETNMV